MSIDPITSARVVTGCVLAFAASLSSFAAVGCGASPCEEAIEALCAKACECGRCGLALPSQSELAEGSIKLYFSDEGDCQAATNCEDSKATDAQFETCTGDVSDATCEEGAVLLPDSCGET